MKLKLIACGVFRPEIEALAREIEHEVVLAFLPQGLHAKPAVLREELQALIDSTSPDDGFHAIAIAYGLCGRGAAGITARHIPLVIPRIHDCIAGFLGSHKRYMEEFSRNPGTYWFTRGFIKSGGQPGVPGKHRGITAKYETQFEEYAERYGDETARYLVEEWSQGWMKNYSRAAFVPWDYPEVEEDRDLTRGCAARLGWNFEEIPADLSMLRDLLSGQWSPDRFLEVLPGTRIVPVHDARIMEARAPGEELIDPEAAELWQVFESDGDGVRLLTDDPQPLPPDTIGVTSGSNAGLGLGIDAGGTFTDVVLYDFSTRSVLASAKAPTTPAEPAIGVAEAVGQLPSERLGSVSRVTMATTFATNAIVESKGRRVGLLALGYDDWSLARIDHTPTRRVAGAHRLDGTVSEPFDSAAVVAAVRAFRDEDGVEAIAIVEHNGCRNPEFEQQALELATGEFDGPVQCAHELTTEIDRLRRATTVAINGRIAPIIIDLVKDIESVLQAHRVAAPLSVVRADGSVMTASEACDRPVEMVLSGPAASICGAQTLSQQTNAIVVDIGGTTADTALLVDGRPRHNAYGAVVGGHRTAVRAPALQTTGLGGDSQIQLATGGNIQIGPRRVIPLSVLAAHKPDIAGLLDELHTTELAELDILPAGELYTLAREPGKRESLTEREKQIVEVLRNGPASILGLSRGIDYPYLSCINTGRLEATGIVIRSGFTPTDLLHVEGRMDRWNIDVARTASEHLAARAGLSPEIFVARVHQQIIRMLSRVILSVGLGLSEPDQLDAYEIANRLFTSAVSSKPDGVVQSTLSLSVPIIGIGAPAYAFVPEVAELLGTAGDIPEAAGVAGAVGAITGSVSETVTVVVKPTPTGFTVHAPDEARNFPMLEEAKEFARDRAVALSSSRSLRSGAERALIRLHSADHIASLGEGGSIYLETVVEAEASGAPNVVRS